VGQPVEGGGLLEAQHLEGIPIQGLTLEGAGDEGPGEPLADPNRLGVVVVGAAGGASFTKQRNHPRQLGLVGGPVLVPAEEAGVMDPPQDDERADLEPPGKPLELLGQRLGHLDVGSNRLERDQELGSNLVAPPLGQDLRCRHEVGVGERGLTQP